MNMQQKHAKFITFINRYCPISPRCQCPAQFEGPECQQNKHSFHGNGYAWFPPMMPCFESHVSLEFITDMVDGLLLYSGPLAQLQAWDHEDFMAIGRRPNIHPITLHCSSKSITETSPSKLLLPCV